VTTLNNTKKNTNFERMWKEVVVASLRSGS